MPEIPDLELYRSALESRVVGQKLERVRLGSPFLVRSVEPPLASTFGHVVRGTRRVGKRIVFELDNALFIVIHLMIAGRFQWKAAGAKLREEVGQLEAGGMGRNTAEAVGALVKACRLGLHRHAAALTELYDAGLKPDWW